MESESGEPQPFPSAADIDAVLTEFGGDPRAAIAALLHDVAALAADYGLSVSRGYVRRGTSLAFDLSAYRRQGERAAGPSTSPPARRAACTAGTVACGGEASHHTEQN